MNVCWCAPSGGGCTGGRVSNVVGVATCDVCPGCARLMASLAGPACGTGMANLDLVTMCPAVPDLVPRRFGVAPVRGVDMGFCQGDRSSQWGRGWNAGSAHSCNGELDVDYGFGEHCVGDHQVLYGGILLNGCICKIVKRRSHLLCLFELGGLSSATCYVPSSHAIDVAHFGKGGGPMGLPVGPSVVNRWAMLPLTPGQHHVATR